MDYTKLDISHVGWPRLSRNKLLKWLPLVDTQTGELNPIFSDYKKRKLRPEYIAEYKGLIFEKYATKNNQTKIYILGSPHYYYNDGKHNYNTYNLEAHRTVIKSLCDNFGIDPHKTTIHHIEICVLLFCLLYSTDNLLDNIMAHFTKGGKMERFNFEKKFTESNFKIMRRSRYSIKAYDKAMQFKLKESSFKFEVKNHHMDALTKGGSKLTLADTLTESFINAVGELLLQRWNETLLYDWTINTDQLTRNQKVKLKDYRNQNYWIDLSKNGKKNQLSREIKKYKKIVANHSQNVHKYIGEMIEKEWVRTFKNGGKLPLSESESQNMNGGKLPNSIVETNHHLKINADSIKSDKNLTIQATKIAKKEGAKFSWIYPIEIAHLHNDHPSKKAFRNKDSNKRNNCRKRYKKEIREMNSSSLFDPDFLVLEIPKPDYLLLKYFEGTALDILPKLNYKIVG